jgi:hypothetical protein
MAVNWSSVPSIPREVARKVRRFVCHDRWWGKSDRLGRESGAVPPARAVPMRGALRSGWCGHLHRVHWRPRHRCSVSACALRRGRLMLNCHRTKRPRTPRWTEALEPRRLLSSTVVPLGGGQELIHDAARGLLYVPVGTNVQRFDVASRSLLAPITGVGCTSPTSSTPPARPTPTSARRWSARWTSRAAASAASRSPARPPITG